jgi:hypothetical protein
LGVVFRGGVQVGGSGFQPALLAAEQVDFPQGVETYLEQVEADAGREAGEAD